MKRTVYLDTTIPSFLFDTRTDMDIVVKIEKTRRWLERASGSLEMFISDAVLTELEAGDYEHKREAMDFVSDLASLELTEEVLERASIYVAHRVMPGSPDAVHLAVASFYGCHFLASWNMRHLVNPNKWQHIRHVDDMMGWHTPSLQTPEMMLESGET